MAKYDTTDCLRVTLPRSLYTDMITKVAGFYGARGEIETVEEIAEILEAVEQTWEEAPHAH